MPGAAADVGVAGARLELLVRPVDRGDPLLDELVLVPGRREAAHPLERVVGVGGLRDPAAGAERFAEAVEHSQLAAERLVAAADEERAAFDGEHLGVLGGQREARRVRRSCSR